MSNKQATSNASTIDSSSDPSLNRESVTGEVAAKPGYFKRYRLPLTLAVVAACLYVGSILYILLGRGQIS